MRNIEDQGYLYKNAKIVDINNKKIVNEQFSNLNS